MLDFAAMTKLTAKSSAEHSAQLAKTELSIKHSAKDSTQHSTQPQPSSVTRFSRHKSKSKSKKKKLELAETKRANVSCPPALAVVETKRAHVRHSSPIFCCSSAFETFEDNTIKLHLDPNRELHEAIYRSFIAFTARCQRVAELTELIHKYSGAANTLPSTSEPPTLPPAPEPIFMQAPLKNNPLTPQTPYVVHLTARHDFGPVYSHRYFVCPEKLEQDWVELSLLEWYVAGESFKMCAERWDLKCIEDNKFFRMTLRPNLAMRGCYVPREINEGTGEGRCNSIGEAECKGRYIDG